VPVSRIEHLLVLTDDIDETRDFWCASLGLEVGERPPLEFAGHWLYAEGVPCVHVADRGEYTAHSERVGIPASPEAVDHVAFKGVDYEEVVERLESNGVEAARNTVPGVGLRQLFLTDPNGLKIEINVPPDGKEPL
jgi:catechol 2,3-dioxygenase-like lactoylglutathione lyase family enzyme